MRGNDYKAPISETREKMGERYRSSPEYAHPSERKYGGPEAYVEHLKKVLADTGFADPVDVLLQRSKIFGGTGEQTHIFDGHHRALAAMESNQFLPVSFW
jgi:hypothetical protein